MLPWRFVPPTKKGLCNVAALEKAAGFIPYSLAPHSPA